MTSTVNNTLIIIAHSARALAESAVNAGWDVITIDGFADLDAISISNSSWCLPLYSAAFLESHVHVCIEKIAAHIPHARVLLGAGAEHFADWIKRHTSWSVVGSSVQVLEAINDPNKFFESLKKLGINFPTISFRPRSSTDTQHWIYKRATSCGGAGIQMAPLDKTMPMIENGYWQQVLSGQSISALCISDGKWFRCIGINKLMTQSLGESYPFIYQGALANFSVKSKTYKKIVSYIDKLLSVFNIVGIFSVDMIIQEGVKDSNKLSLLEENPQIFILEINARVSASFELYERINPDLNLVDEHIRVCEGVAESKFAHSKFNLNRSVSASRIVYAPKYLKVANDVSWPDWCKDIPHPGREINSGEPICSIYADNIDTSNLSQLDERENEVINYLTITYKNYLESK